VPLLALPTVTVHASFLEAMEEFRNEGHGNASDDSTIGRDLRLLGDTWHEPDVFASYVEQLRAERLEETPRPPGWVPCTTWWWLEGEIFLGRIALRHRLTENLRAVGGHVGYDVRPSARRQGHATAMLRQVLIEAAVLGIADVLVTCDRTNVGSQRVIEACGGQLDHQRGHKLRYWIGTRR
jgi:predicted acetyltransferase